MEFDFSLAVTDDLRDIARLNTAIADILIAGLKERHPRNMHEFFPRALSPIPDTELAGAFGAETLKDVMAAAEAAAIVSFARCELEMRKFPN